MLLAIVVFTNALSATRYKMKYIAVPKVEHSYLIVDNYGNIVTEENSRIKRPIASISKLMIGLLAATQVQDELLSIPNKRNVQRYGKQYQSAHKDLM